LKIKDTRLDSRGEGFDPFFELRLKLPPWLRFVELRGFLLKFRAGIDPFHRSARAVDSMGAALMSNKRFFRREPLIAGSTNQIVFCFWHGFAS